MIKYWFVIVGALWGICWAIFMQCTRVGWLISTKQTWLGVVLGVGGNLLIGFFVMDRDSWQKMGAITAASAIAVGFRSLWNQSVNTESEVQELWQQIQRYGVGSDYQTTSREV